MAKNMTLEQRAHNHALNRSPSHTGNHNAQYAGYIAGWRARGRADAATKTERAVIEAAVAWANANHRDKTLTVWADLANAVAALERSRSAK